VNPILDSHNYVSGLQPERAANVSPWANSSKVGRERVYIVKVKTVTVPLSFS